jgi:hypothetical protein
MIELDEDLFIKEGYINADKFETFAAEVKKTYPILQDYVEEFSNL